VPLVEMSGELSRRFAAIDFLNDSAGREDFHIVTGFGPTNAPTAGTLSIMCGIVEAQQAFRLPLTVVISDLGAWNCRNVAWADLCEFRNRMRAFLLSLGFDDTVGKIRSHLETENLIRAGRIARYLKLEDFEQYQDRLSKDPVVWLFAASRRSTSLDLRESFSIDRDPRRLGLAGVGI
jgi:hypothetical protein